MIIKILNINEVLNILDDMFEIINYNMSKIIPSDNSKEDNYKMWKKSMLEELDNKNKKWVASFENNILTGYFLYRLENEILYLDEVQVREDRQGDKKTFISLIKMLLKDNNIKDDYEVRLYVNKNNKKSQYIVTKKLDFKILEEKERGIRYINNFTILKEHINNY